MAATKGSSKSCQPQSKLGETFKAEANELYLKGHYKEAYGKYSEAIKEDPKNAVYYANRAAASLALNEYMDALSDAMTATQLDPQYAKAWARLATASHSLGLWPVSIDAWKKALGSLPALQVTSPAESDKRLRVLFSDGLQRTVMASKVAKNPDTKNAPRLPQTDRPWHRAKAAQARLQLITNGETSSGLVILKAYEDFQCGVEAMKRSQLKILPPEQVVGQGCHGALLWLSKGIMRDPRVFHMDCHDWMYKYQTQVMFEIRVDRGWGDGGGAKAVIKEATIRLEKEGWNHLHQALSMTIRAWILNGVIMTATGRPVMALEFYSRALEVLNWGSRTWSDVPHEDRDCIFARTFVRCVERFRNGVMHVAIEAKAENCRYTKDDLAENCRKLIAEVEAELTDPELFPRMPDQAFFLSFWQYPRADSYSHLGWCHLQSAASAKNKKVALLEYKQAVSFYLKASAALPQDDETCSFLLTRAVEAQWHSNRPLKDILPVIVNIENSFSKAMQLWEHTGDAAYRNEYVTKPISFGLACQKALKDGLVSLESIVKPLAMKTNDRWAMSKVVYI